MNLCPRLAAVLGRAVLRAVLVGLGVVMALLAAEAATRVLGSPYEQVDNSYRCDRWVGWRGLPNHSHPLTTDRYQHLVTRNAAGMHDQAYDPVKPQDTFRILVLGDSFVEALQVNLEETTQTQLERDLQALMPAGKRIEVIAAAAGGWSPANQLMYFRSTGKALEPDLVLVLWAPENDLSDILPESRLTHQGVNCYAPYFVVCAGAFDPGPWFSAPGIPPTWRACSLTKKRLVSLLSRLYQVSHLYQRMEPLLTSHYHKLEYSNPYAPWLEQSQRDPALQYAYQLTDGIYARLAAEAAAVGAKTAFVIVPSKTALQVKEDPDYLNELQDAGISAGGSVVDVALSNRRFTALMTQRRLPSLDLFPLFLDRLKSGQGPLYWQTDTHWNVAGNRLAAELITRWLVASHLVPTEME